MADFAYTVGIDVDSSGLDSFISRARSLAQNISFGSSFNIPSGVSATGPGVTQGPSGAVANFSTGPQAIAFANAVRQSLSADLAAARAAGKGNTSDYKEAKRAADAVSNALEAGARKFGQILAAVRGPVTPARLADAQRQARTAIDASLADSEKREIKNAKQREARAARKTAAQEDQNARLAEEEAQARRDATKAHRQAAQAAGKSAAESERLGAEGARQDAQKNLEKRRATQAAKKEADAREAAARKAEQAARSPRSVVSRQEVGRLAREDQPGFFQAIGGAERFQRMSSKVYGKPWPELDRQQQEAMLDVVHKNIGRTQSELLDDYLKLSPLPDKDKVDLAAAQRQALRSELDAIPVPPGHTRVYRGEFDADDASRVRGEESSRGQWWSADYEYADTYARSRPGERMLETRPEGSRVLYQDVPDEQLRAGATQMGAQGTTEFLLDAALRDEAATVEDLIRASREVIQARAVQEAAIRRDAAESGADRDAEIEAGWAARDAELDADRATNPEDRRLAEFRASEADHRARYERERAQFDRDNPFEFPLDEPPQQSPWEEAKRFHAQATTEFIEEDSPFQDDFLVRDAREKWAVANQASADLFEAEDQGQHEEAVDGRLSEATERLINARQQQFRAAAREAEVATRLAFAEEDRNADQALRFEGEQFGVPQSEIDAYLDRVASQRWASSHMRDVAGAGFEVTSHPDATPTDKMRSAAAAQAALQRYQEHLGDLIPDARSTAEIEGHYQSFAAIISDVQEDFQRMGVSTEEFRRLLEAEAAEIRRRTYGEGGPDEVIAARGRAGLPASALSGYQGPGDEINALEDALEAELVQELNAARQQSEIADRELQQAQVFARQEQETRGEISAATQQRLEAAQAAATMALSERIDAVTRLSEARSDREYRIETGDGLEPPAFIPPIGARIQERANVVYDELSAAQERHGYEAFTGQGVPEGLHRDRFLIAARANADRERLQAEAESTREVWEGTPDATDVDNGLDELSSIIHGIGEEFQAIGISADEFYDALRRATAYLRRFGAEHPDLPHLEDPLEQRRVLDEAFGEIGPGDFDRIRLNAFDDIVPEDITDFIDQGNAIRPNVPDSEPNPLSQVNPSAQDFTAENFIAVEKRLAADEAAKALADEKAFITQELDMSGEISEASRRRLIAKRAAADSAEREAVAAHQAAMDAATQVAGEDFDRRQAEPGPKIKDERGEWVPVEDADTTHGPWGDRGPSHFEAAIGWAEEADAKAKVQSTIDRYQNQQLGFREMLNQGFRGADADPSITGRSGRMAEADEALAAQKARVFLERYDRGLLTVQELHYNLELINEELRQQQAAAAAGAEAQERAAREAAEGARLQSEVNDAKRGGHLNNLPNVPDTEREAARRAGGGAGGGGGTPPRPPGGGGPDDPGDDDDEQYPRPGKTRLPAGQGLGSAGYLDGDIRKAKQDELAGLQKRLAIMRVSTETDQQIARVKAEILLEERKQARREREQNQAVFSQAREEGFFNVGTRAQRVQAAFKSRDGNLVDPLSQQRGGALLATRAFQASSFAIGGMAFYGALQLIRDTLEETEKLEREFFVVRGQIERTFGEQSGAIFERFKEQVRSISLETGQLGSEVALVTRQLAAAFVDREETPEVQAQQFDRAGRNARAAFKFAEVTGLDPKEMTDSLTALGLSFDELNEDFRPILDSAIALEEQFGVLGGQIITFAADLAPLAANLGFSAEQLTALGAVAQKFSGRAGGQLSEQFGRIFSDLPQKAPDLIGIFERTPQLADLSKGLADAFVGDNMEQVLEFILQASARIKDQNLNPGLITEISDKVAGRREGASFAAILRQPNELLAALNADGADAAGALDQRFAEVRDSLSETMERMRRSVEQLAEAILSAGLADAIKVIASGLGAMASAAAAVIRFFDRINDATGGLAGTFLGLYAIVKSLDAAFRAMATSNVIAALLGPRVAGVLKGGAAGGFTGLLRTGAGAAAGGIGAGFAAARAGGIGGLAGLAGRGLAGLGGSLGSTLGYWGGSGAILGRSILPSLGAGGAGAIAAGVAAPVGAAISLIELKGAVSDVRGMVKEAGNALRIQMQGADFRQIIAAMQVGDTDTRFRVGIPGTDVGYSVPGTQIFGRTVLGELPEDIRNEVAVENLGGEGLTAALGAINPEEDLSESGRERYAAAYLELEKWARGEDADLESVLELIGDIGGEKANLADAMAEGVENAAEVEAAAKEINEGSSGPELQALIQALASNRGTPEQVRTALAAAVAPLEVMAQAAVDAGDFTAYLSYLEQISQLRDATDRALSDYAVSATSFGERFRTLFGDDRPETRILVSTRILQDPNVTDDETRFNALQQLQAARDEAFQKRLDNARNEEERLRILDEGPGVDLVAQAEALYLQIDESVEKKITELRSRQFDPAAPGVDKEGFRFKSAGTQVADQISQLEGLTREGIVEISEQLIEDIETYGEGAIRIRLGLLQARRNELFALARSLGPGTAGRAVQAEIAVLNGQIDTYTALQESGVDPTGLVVDDGEADDDPVERERKRRELARDRRLAEINRARAAANGDPVREAQLARDAAAVSRAYAIDEFGAGSIEAINAQAEYINAQNAQNDAFNDVAAAQLELAAARAEKNPLDSALIAIQQADLAVRTAKGTAERLRAEAQRHRAGEAFADAIRDVADAQHEYLIAVAEANGDAIGAIEERKKQISEDIELARARGDIAGEIRGEGDLVAATRQGYDAVLDKQRSDIDFALQMEQISKQQAIASYRMLLEIPTNTEAQNRELQLIIKGLQDELGQDYQFNLPSNLNLPTLYEARRLDQAGGGGYQDNRQININFTANNTADAEMLVNSMVEQLNRPSRFGTAGRMY